MRAADRPGAAKTAVAAPAAVIRTSAKRAILRALMQRIYRSRMLPGKHKKLLGWEQDDKVIDIDQSPIGRTPHSNPATYTLQAAASNGATFTGWGGACTGIGPCAVTTDTSKTVFAYFQTPLTRNHGANK